MQKLPVHIVLFGVAHAPFACQCWGLDHRLAQCATVHIVLKE